MEIHLLLNLTRNNAMIKRIVKLVILEDKVPDFLDNFEKIKFEIRNFEGNHHVELLQDIKNKNQFFTYSYWDNEEFLEKYRNSAFFNEVWKFTKTLFEEKAQAWSIRVVETV